MAEADVQFTAGLDSKQYESATVRMGSAMASTSARIIADMDATTKATARMASAVDGAGKKMYALGQVSMQLQDVAVQLQNGTKFATVFAQQGSQIASAFGAQGAIIGGVIAIGAAIYTWASGAKETEEAVKRIENNAKAAASALERVQTGINSDKQATATAKGKEEGAEERYQQRLQELKDAEKLVKWNDASANAKIEEARAAALARRDAELEAEAAKELAEYYKEVDRDTERTVKARAELSSVSSPQQRMSDLAKEIGALSGSVKAKDMADMAEKQVELARLGKEIGRENLNNVEEADRKKKKSQDDFERMQERHQVDLARREEIIRNVGKLEEKKSIAEAKDRLAQDVEVGERVLSNAERIRSGVSKSDIRREARAQAKAERRAINQEIDAEDRNRRKRGLAGLTEEEKKERRERRQAGVQAAKNKDVLNATIEPSDIEELAKKIAEENAKLITK